MPLLKPGASATPEAPAAPPRAREGLLAALRTGATEMERREAALDLASMPEAADALGAALAAEPAARVREAIITALLGIGTPAAAAVLAGVLGSEDTALRNDAIEALRELGPAAIAPIERLLESPVADIRMFAVSVLNGLGHTQASRLLQRVLECDPEINVGLAAVEVLVEVGGPESLPALRAFAARFPDEPFVHMAVDLACRRAATSGPP
jgi:HEAT repeat protein